MLFSYCSFAASLLLTFLIAESDRDAPRPMLLFYFSFNFHATYTLPYFYFTSHLVVTFLCAPRAGGQCVFAGISFQHITSRAIVCICGGGGVHMWKSTAHDRGRWVGWWVGVRCSLPPAAQQDFRSQWEGAHTHTHSWSFNMDNISIKFNLIALWFKGRNFVCLCVTQIWNPLEELFSTVLIRSEWQLSDFDTRQKGLLVKIFE